MAEYDNPGDLLAAARSAYQAGYRRLDAYSPMPVHGLAGAIGFHRNGLPLLVLVGGSLGCLLAFSMLWYVETHVYPINVGGRPFNSWPAFIPITFEVTILFAAITAVLGMLALNGLPTPYHPVFNAKRFALASRNRFFLSIEVRDPMFELEATRGFLEGTHCTGVEEIDL
jgi:hypothetical protein